jgi:hypothetical protein
MPNLPAQKFRGRIEDTQYGDTYDRDAFRN